MQSISAIDISSAGMAAERRRMEVTANNIANANTTMTDRGEPFRRQMVVFSSADDASGATEGGWGVRVEGVEPDPTDFPAVYNPGHPHADQQGMVRLPNVQLPNEMIDLITASRSYEANLRAITLYREMVEQTLSLLNGGRS